MFESFFAIARDVAQDDSLDAAVQHLALSHEVVDELEVRQHSASVLLCLVANHFDVDGEEELVDCFNDACDAVGL